MSERVYYRGIEVGSIDEAREMAIADGYSHIDIHRATFTTGNVRVEVFGMKKDGRRMEYKGFSRETQELKR